jgi:hypothetical protein
MSGLNESAIDFAEEYTNNNYPALRAIARMLDAVPRSVVSGPHTPERETGAGADNTGAISNTITCAHGTRPRFMRCMACLLGTAK